MMLLSTENISYSVSDKKLFSEKTYHQILKDICLNIPYGDILGIAGESGSGKTTLAKVIAGLITPTSGTLKFIFRRKPVENISPVQILFQNNGEIINPYRRGIDIIKEVLLKRYRGNWIKEMDKIITSLSIPEHILNRRGLELSGGEQQRIALGRVLAAGPELLILDEPFSAQDPASQANLLTLFKKINNEHGITLICISHYTGILKNLCRNMIVLFEGEIIEEQNTNDFFNNPRHPYTRYLLSAENYKLSPEELTKRREF